MAILAGFNGGPRAAMTVPMEYWNASKDFEAFLTDFRDTAMLQTHHQAYHSIRAVLHVFRSHLDTQQALQFAGVLPPVLRAIFVEDWRPLTKPTPFPDRTTLFREIKSIRPDHNLAPDSVIGDAASALRRHVDNAALEALLKSLPPGAREFWAI